MQTQEEVPVAVRRTAGIWLIKAADTALLCACLGGIAAVYILDAIFFAAWAPEWWLIPVFILIGLVIRTIAVSAGVALQWVRRQEEIRTARTTVRAIWVLCLIACLVPAMSFFAGGQKAQTQGGDISAAVLEAGTSSRDVQKAELQGQIDKLREDRDKAIAEARASIKAIQDEVDGMSAADNASVQKLQDDISKYQADAAAAILAKEAEINAIGKEQQGAQQDTARDETKVSIFFAIFTVVEEVTGLDARDTSIVTLFYFALLIEVIAAFGLGAYYDLHKVFARLITQWEAGTLEVAPPAPRSRKPLLRIPKMPRMPWMKGPAADEATPVDNSPVADPPASDPVGDPPSPVDDPPGADPLKDARADWTDQQWNGAKGPQAKDHYEAARDATKVRIPPVLTIDAAATAEPAPAEEEIA